MNMAELMREVSTLPAEQQKELAAYRKTQVVSPASRRDALRRVCWCVALVLSRVEGDRMAGVWDRDTGCGGRARLFHRCSLGNPRAVPVAVLWLLQANISGIRPGEQLRAAGFDPDSHFPQASHAWQILSESFFGSRPGENRMAAAWAPWWTVVLRDWH